MTLSFSQGETAEEMGAKCRQHAMEMLQSGDEGHNAAVESMMQLSKEEQEKCTTSSEVSLTHCRAHKNHRLPNAASLETAVSTIDHNN